MTTPDHVNREKARKLLEPARKAWDEVLKEPLSRDILERLANLQ